MSFNNIYKFDTAMKENEELLKNNMDEFRAKASSFINTTTQVIEITFNLTSMMYWLVITTNKKQQANINNYIKVLTKSNIITQY